MKPVLIRDNTAGVFFGKLESMDLATGTWVLTEARKIHYWTQAGAVEGVAAHGIGRDSRVTAEVSRISGRALIQAIDLTETQYATLRSFPEWKP